jgi:hypothetical protein
VSQPAAGAAVAPLQRRPHQPRHRYWSIRDLSRRIWYGRGYELLRLLIRSGILPATRSTRSWWVADADVRGLLAAFDGRAGKVRAFRRLDGWLRERCYVVPLTAEVANALDGGRAGLAWRGRAYLPQSAWQADVTPDGATIYRHRSGAAIGSTMARAA